MKIYLQIRFLVSMMVLTTVSPVFGQKTETVKKPDKKLYGHQRDVSALTVSHKGKLMVTGSWRNDAILWSLGEEPEKQWQFEAHQTTVEGVDISHDNAYIATCSDDASAYIWSIEEEKRIMTLGGHGSTINDITFNDHLDENEGRFVATATNKGVVRVYDRNKKGKIIRKIQLEKRRAANAVVFDKSGKFVIIGDGKGDIQVYNFLKGEKSRTLKGHKSAINGLDLSSDGMQLVSGSSDQTAKIWSYAKGKVLNNLKGHSWRVLDVAFGPKNEYVVTGSNDKSARLWEVSSGKQLRVFKPKGKDYFRAVGMSPDQQYAITGSLVREGEKDAAVLFWPTGL